MGINSTEGGIAFSYCYNSVTVVQAIFLIGFLCAIASRLEYYLAPQYHEWNASKPPYGPLEFLRLV